MSEKLILRALKGEILGVPPVWLMRQAGRYLPEYRATREKAGSFLDLCYNPELAAEVALQPIRRFGFDAAILFADILLIPHALGASVEFSVGGGPRLSTITSHADLMKLKPVSAIHETLAPVYQTIRYMRELLPRETTLIGFAGAPWTVASYMIAGLGTPDQAPGRRFLYREPATFYALLDLIADATAEYLIAQIQAGAEVVKLFDSWAGSVGGSNFESCCIRPVQRILKRVRDVYPDIPVIAFPRNAGGNYVKFVQTVSVQGLALDSSVSSDWAIAHLRPSACLQGNLDPLLVSTGGIALTDATRRMVNAFSQGPHIFNLGHGITPDANPAHVEQMLKAIRG